MDRAASCFHNVFSIEGNAFTTYYGESMKLRTVHGVSPIGSDIRLSDGHKQASPLALFNSGKKTDAPVISALYPWKPQEKLDVYKRQGESFAINQSRSADGDVFQTDSPNK